MAAAPNCPNCKAPIHKNQFLLSPYLAGEAVWNTLAGTVVCPACKAKLRMNMWRQFLCFGPFMMYGSIVSPPLLDLMEQFDLIANLIAAIVFWVVGLLIVNLSYSIFGKFDLE